MIAFNTPKPADLLAKFDNAIKKNNAAGGIATWEKVEGGYYTHEATQWKRKAYFKPHIDAGRLRFTIVKPKNANVTRLVYGYYHGHLAETFLNHFDQEFTAVEVTPLCAQGDLCSLAA